MGNCPVVPPPDSTRGSFSPSDSSHGFLQLHRPDRTRILETPLVNAVLDQQAEDRCQQEEALLTSQAAARLVREQAFHRGSPPFLEPERDIYANVRRSVRFANDHDSSNVTIFSEATQQVKNADKYEPMSAGYSTTAHASGGANARQRQPQQPEPEEETEWTNAGDLRSPCRSRLLGCYVPPSVGPAANLYTKQVSSERAHRDALAERKKQYASVLHLRIKAKLLDYYQSQFLSHFTDMDSTTIEGPFLPVQSYHSPPRALHGERRYDANSTWPSHNNTNKELTKKGGVPHSYPVQLDDHSSFLDLAVTGSLGLTFTPALATPQSGEVPAFCHHQSLEHYLVLMNRKSGTPLAVCALKTQVGLPVVRVYATKQRVAGQRRAALTSALGFTWCNAVPLYTWAEIQTETAFPMPFQYSIYMANGTDGSFDSKPSYKATSSMFTASADFQIVGRTDAEDAYSGCALLTVEAAADGLSSSGAGGGTDACFKLSISRGIDPALLICFAAVVDETMEHAMRRFCENRPVAV